MQKSYRCWIEIVGRGMLVGGGSAPLVLLHWLAFYCGIQSMNWCIDTRWMYYVYMVPMYRSYCELLEISEKKIVRYLTAIRMSVRPSVCSSIGVSIIAMKLIVDSLMVDFCKKPYMYIFSSQTCYSIRGSLSSNQFPSTEMSVFIFTTG